ncbi:hypothetical protein MRB53_027091 [Persea americana]|uniref:Uncharacterized protein n=1 Tax=Persea americana TaxID=3435 RepID=A0ACC2LKF2_PERAE|nr:hypothetical protein MRB53_027091 [Persea americana]
MGLGSKRSRDGDSSSASEDESDLEIGESEEEEEEMGFEKKELKRDAEMEELEKEYLNLRNQEEDLVKSLTRHKDEDLLKGQAVKNQKALWDKTLELRCLLQKSFSSSNKLPQGNFRSSFCSDKTVDKAYADLIASSEQTLNSLLELQEALLENNRSIAPVTNEAGESGNGEDALNNSDVEIDEEWLRIHRMNCRLAPFRDSSIDKWQRKTQVATGAAAFKGKLHAFNQNISQQVAAYMRDPNRMIKRMQLRRSTVGVLGEVPDEANKTREEDANVEGDPELLDDSDFYHQLLKEFLDSCDSASSGSAFYALKKLQPKKRKVVDRRASKSRKIRYHVHEKIVNFMAPEPMVIPPYASKLFENLFGQHNQKPASVV